MVDWSESDEPWSLEMSSASHSSKLPLPEGFEPSSVVILLSANATEFRSFNLNGALSSLVSVEEHERLGDEGGWMFHFSSAIAAH